jgi:hypothetical protein
MADDDFVDEKQRSRRAPVLLVMVALSPVFYVLSYGPAYWLAYNTNREWVRSTVGNVYMPLELLYRLCLRDTWCGDMLTWYMRLWMQVTSEPASVRATGIVGSGLTCGQLVIGISTIGTLIGVLI